MNTLLLTGIRVYLGVIWLQSGTKKVRDPRWMESGEAVRDFWSRAVELPDQGRPKIKFQSYRALLLWMLDNDLHPSVAKLLVATNLVTGIALLLGVAVRPAALLSVLQNMAFALAGSSDHNPPMLVAGTILAMSDTQDAGRISVASLI